jgi:uncharacterized protein YkwD
MTRNRTYFLPAIAFLAAAAALPAMAQEVPVDAGTLKATVFGETNAYRGSKKLPELRTNAALEAAAMAYAKYLAEHDATGHTADGRTPAKRVNAQGYRWCYLAENVWSSWSTSQTMLAGEVARRAMEGWKKSPGHNANLLGNRVHEIGIGAAAWKQGDGRESFRVVQVFADDCSGKPRPAPTLGELIGRATELLH